MGRGGSTGQGGSRRQVGRAPTSRPNFDHLLRVEELRNTSIMAPKVAKPLKQAIDRGVIGWVISGPEECFEVYKDKTEAVNLHDLPVPVACDAWMAEWLTFDDVMVVLAARDQISKPGDEHIQNDDDGHYEAYCWCGWVSELHVDDDVVARDLDDHTRMTHGHAANTEVWG